MTARRLVAVALGVIGAAAVMWSAGWENPFAVEHAYGVQGFASVVGGYMVGAALVVGWYSR